MVKEFGGYFAEPSRPNSFTLPGKPAGVGDNRIQIAS
jgi:hypothetical protein